MASMGSTNSSSNSGGQRERAELFRRLHEQGSSLVVLPNAWDAPSARIFEQRGQLRRRSSGNGLLKCWSASQT
jgi:2-methylisocitrate lyase-like PEP mutase family enzyme